MASNEKKKRQIPTGKDSDSDSDSDSHSHDDDDNNLNVDDSKDNHSSSDVKEQGEEGTERREEKIRERILLASSSNDGKDGDGDEDGNDNNDDGDDIQSNQHGETRLQMRRDDPETFFTRLDQLPFSQFEKQNLLTESISSAIFQDRYEDFVQLMDGGDARGFRLGLCNILERIIGFNRIHFLKFLMHRTWTEEDMEMAVWLTLTETDSNSPNNPYAKEMVLFLGRERYMHLVNQYISKHFDEMMQE